MTYEVINWQINNPEINAVLHDLRYYGLDEIRERVETEINPLPYPFPYGGGVNAERNRFTSAYCVTLVGDAYYLLGEHTQPSRFGVVSM